MVWKSVTPSFTGDSQHFGGDDGLNKYANLFNGVLDVDVVDINSGFTIRSGKGKIRNPANTFSYIIVGAAIAADRNLTLPLSTGDDTFAALGTAQTFTAVQTFDTYHDSKQIVVPASPASTYHRVYVDTADGHLKKKDSTGAVIDYNAAVSGGEINTVSNIGTAGVGIYKQKTSVNFELKKINAGSAYITITDDTGNNEVDIGIGANVATLNTAQTFTAVKTFDDYSDIKQVLAPTNPAATYHRLYIDSADSHLKRKDSAGGVKDYDAGTGGGGSGGTGTPVSTTYDTFASSYDITTDDTLSPNSLWRCIYHGSHPPIYYVLEPGNDGTSMGAGATIRYGVNINGATGELVGMPLKTWTTRLRKAGTPTGSVTAVVRNAADTIVATFSETLNPTTLPTSYTDVVWTLASPYTIADGDRILVEYSGTINTVQIELFNTEQFDGLLTRRTGYVAAYTQSNISDITGSMNVLDNGQVGVRVPAGGAFPRVMYMYPYSIANKTLASRNLNGYEGTSASLVLTEAPYYSDFDVTFYMRTKTQLRTTPNAWETAWFMWHFNESENTNFHHYYLALKSNGTIELGRKDNAVSAEEQYFLDTSATFSYSAGTWYKIRVRVISNAITIWVNDIQKIDIVDNGGLGAQVGAPNTPPIPSVYMYSGKFGFYNEDAEVEFSPMVITVAGALVQAYNYLIYTAGSNYTAINGVTNGLEFSGADLQAILAQIETAIPLGGYVRFAPGDFSLTSQWVPTQSNITWMGSGVDVTRIIFDMGSTGAGINYAGAVGSFTNLTANSLKGTKTLTMTSTSGYTAGDWIFLRRNVNMQSGISSTSYDGEFHRISAVTSGTVLTLDTYLHEDYLTSTTSQFALVTFRKSVIFKDMTIYDNRVSVTALAEEGDTAFTLCKDLILENIKFENAVYSSLTLRNCFGVDLNSVKYETPRTIGAGSPIRNGLKVIGATTNLTVDSGSGSRCDNSINIAMATGTGTFSGRPRNIHVQGFKSYDSSSVHYFVDQGPVGVTFTNCGAIGTHLSTETGSNTEQIAFANSAPTTYIGCYTTGAFNQAWDINSNDAATPVGTTQFPQGDRTTLSACRIEDVIPSTTPKARGVRIGPNRAGVIITECQFHNIANEVIDIRAAASNIVITNNVFNSCAGSQTSAEGYIRVLTTASDLIIKHNVFDAGTPSAAGVPLSVVTSIARVIFSENDVNGLTNRMPIIPAASTGVRIEKNIGLNPLSKTANAFNNSNFTVGCYGGTAAAPTSGLDYTVVGADIMVLVTAGTVSDISVLDPVGNVMTSGVTTLAGRYIPRGYKIRITYTIAPTIGIYPI